MDNKKNAIILGLGKSGISAAEFLLQNGFSLIGIDDSIDKIHLNNEIVRLKNLGMKIKKEMESIDVKEKMFVVVSPGVPLDHPAILLAKQHNIEVIGEVELACRYLKQHFCIGITGTNGKTTVTLLIAHILKSVGIRAKAVGNVGLPFTSQLSNKSLSEIDVFVIELSSYQLESMSTKILDLALILNVTPDHLDRYNSMTEYTTAKFKISEILKESGSCYINENLEKSIPTKFSDQNYKFFGFKKTNFLYSDGEFLYKNGSLYCSVPIKNKLKMNHDLENILAAFSICNHFEIKPDEFTKSLESFLKPEHRIEFVRTLEGVSFFNDSKGTNIDAVIKAVNSLDGEIILIAGGVDKGFDYFEWIQFFTRKVKSLYVIGEAARKMETQLKSHISVEVVSDLETAIKKAFINALPGNSVLLSPGCASFDMFINYEHRGHEFKRIVNTLIGKDPKE